MTAGVRDAAMAATFAHGVARLVFDGRIGSRAAEPWARRLDDDGFPEAAEMLRMAIRETEAVRLRAVLPGGA